MPMADPGSLHPEHLLEQACRGDGKVLGRLLEIYRDYLGMLAQLQIDQHRGQAARAGVGQEPRVGQDSPITGHLAVGHSR